MLHLLVLAAVWLGYRAKRANRNVLWWSLIGICFGLAEWIIGVVLMSGMSVSSRDDAVRVTILFNALLIVAILLFGLIVPRTKRYLLREQGSKEVIGPYTIREIWVKREAGQINNSYLVAEDHGQSHADIRGLASKDQGWQTIDAILPTRLRAEAPGVGDSPLRKRG